MISLLVFIACLTVAHAACSCKPFETVKDAFCQSDYVLLARVLAVNSEYGESSTYAANDTNSTDSGRWKYRIWHIRTWKVVAFHTPGRQRILFCWFFKKNVTVAQNCCCFRVLSLPTTPNSECGVTGLLKDWDYFLTGKKGNDDKITLTSRDFVMSWTDLTTGEHDLLMELMWDPKKCEEKHDDKSVKESESGVKETDEKKVDENAGKPTEKNDEKKVEENGEKTAEENDEQKVEENGEETADENDEPKVKENGEETADENDEPKVKENGEETADENDEPKVEENGEKPEEEDNEQKVEEHGEETAEENDEQKVEENDEKTAEENDEQKVEENGEETADENDEPKVEENGEETAEENDEQEMEENSEQT
ncbi:hypothetical protein Aduo_010346 [Ancylostoma duodenale]